jgi:F-type H+-transporting ATPase subunit b
MNITATLFGQMITFAVLVWFVMRFLWEPMINMLEERKKRIADGLAAANSGHKKLKLAEQNSEEQLSLAKQKAGEIISNANQRSKEIIEEAKDKGRTEGKRQIDVALAEISQEKNRASEQLREQLAGLVLEGVRKILEREVKVDNHAEYIDKLAQKL